MSTEQQQVTEQVHYAAELANGTKANSGFTSLGKCLQQARTAAGYTVQQIAAEMHLEPSVIDFIEQDRFKELGAPVFVKGHLRRYARIVSLDEALLCGLYDSLRDPPRAVDPIPVSMNSVPEQRRLMPNWLLWCAATVFVVISAGTIVNKLGSSIEIPIYSNTTSSVQVVKQENSSTVIETPTAGTSATVETKPNSILASVAPISTATAREDEISVAHASQPLPAGQVAVTLRFTGDSWVEVYDANKRLLLQDMAHNSNVHDIAGVAPLRVVLGSSPQVELVINGHATSIPAKRINASVARFAIDANGSIN
jgi:cytoskeleton protein RodZ